MASVTLSHCANGVQNRKCSITFLPRVDLNTEERTKQVVGHTLASKDVPVIAGCTISAVQSQGFYHMLILDATYLSMLHMQLDRQQVAAATMTKD